MRLAWFERGEAAADRVLELNPESVAGLFWKTTNMASGADMKGWASSLWMFPTLKANMEKIGEMDPYYDYGAVERFWSEVLCRVPLWLAGRFGESVEEVVGDLEAQIEREPRAFDNHVYVARLYYKMEEEEKALDHLEYVLSHEPDEMPDRRASNEAQVPVARELWQEITGHEYPQR